MLHEPATPAGKDPAGPYKMRLGVWMFIFYALFYAAFVAINLLSPQAMGAIVFAGLNLATVYGMALIIVAFVEALIYNAMCSKKKLNWSAKRQRVKKRTNPTKKAGLKSHGYFRLYCLCCFLFFKINSSFGLIININIVVNFLFETMKSAIK